MLCLIITIVLAFEGSGASVVRGVDIKNQAFYDPKQDFTCLDGSKTISFSSVNDDYCDCVDGSDEPGTSACPEGKFFCRNAGHKSLYIQSSRVNDGLCDCCDGSDEYDSNVACFNDCDKHMREEMARLKREREEQTFGVEIRKNYIQTGAERKVEKKARSDVLSQLLEEKRAKLEELKASKESAESPEKEAKDKHEKAWEEVKAKKKEEKGRQDRAEAFEMLDLDKNGWVGFAELMAHPNLEADISEEDAKQLLGGEALVNPETFSTVWENIKPKFLKDGRPQPTPETPTEGGESEGGAPPEDGETQTTTTKSTESTEEGKFDMPEEMLEEFEGLSAEERARLELEYKKVKMESYAKKQKNEKADTSSIDPDDPDSDLDDDEDEDEADDVDLNVSRTAKSDGDTDEEKMPEYDDETKRLIEVADQARKAHGDVESELKELESEQSSINDYLNIDFGTEDEFAALKGECFEFTDREYVYRLCPFEKVTQKQKSGGGETDLGRWGEWVKQGDYTEMKYTNGQGCWNGPARSTKVTMSCGRENTINSVLEPSRCEYEMEFKTPALCKGVDHKDLHTEL